MEQGQLSPPLMLPNFSLPHLIPLDDVGMSSDNDNLTSESGDAQKEKRVCRSPPLRHWLNQHRDHPYPTKQEKETLAHDANLTMSQVCNWFANARRRLKIASTTTASATATASGSPLHGVQQQVSLPSAASSRLDGVPIQLNWPHFSVNPAAWPTMPAATELQQQQVVPSSVREQQPPTAGMAVDLRVKKKKKIDVDALQLLPGTLGLQQPPNFDFANNNNNKTTTSSVSNPMANLLYLANLQQAMTATSTGFIPCTGLPGCACVQCLRRWLLATQQQSKDSSLPNTASHLHSSTLPSLPANDDSYPSAMESSLPAGGGRGKFKQAMMNRYLEDTEQHTNIKLRRQSGSLGSEDSDGHSSSDCTSPSSKDHTHLEEPSQPTMWPTSGSSNVESEDLYWKEVMAALALTTMSKSHTLRSDPQVNSSLTTPRL